MQLYQTILSGKIEFPRHLKREGLAVKCIKRAGGGDGEREGVCLKAGTLCIHARYAPASYHVLPFLFARTRWPRAWKG